MGSLFPQVQNYLNALRRMTGIFVTRRRIVPGLSSRPDKVPNLHDRRLLLDLVLTGSRFRPFQIFLQLLSSPGPASVILFAPKPTSGAKLWVYGTKLPGN
jgi:hypothetical protein